MSSDIQAIVFLPSKKFPYTSDSARRWLKSHNLIPIKRVDKVKNKDDKITQLRYRIKDPKQFKSYITKKTKENINIVIGFYK